MKTIALSAAFQIMATLVASGNEAPFAVLPQHGPANQIPQTWSA